MLPSSLLQSPLSPGYFSSDLHSFATFSAFFFSAFVSLGAAGVTGAEIGWFSGGSRNWTTLLLCDVQVHTSCFLIYKNKSNFLQEVCYDKRVC